MIPPTPTSLTTMPASKAKIGFSIDSIVGDKTTKDNRNDFKFNDYQTEIARALRLSSDSLNPDGHSKFRNGNDKETRHNLFDFSTKRESSLSPSAPYAAQTGLPTEENTTRKSRSPSPHRTPNNNNNNTNINNNSMTPGNGGPNNNNLHSSGSNPNSNESSPIVPLPFSTFRENHPSGPIRPMPMVPPPNLVEQKTLPSFLGLGGGAHANPHLLQIQMATVMAQRQAAEQGFVTGAPFRHAPQPHLMNPAMAREGYPLYPWLLSRHGRMFPHFPGNFLLHPFRKPKRVRTAFSPGQLLKLEHAFESNQYVVGAERKALAQALNLSETQVKVWFQNRRTKHKRMQQEDDTKGEGGHHSNNNDGSYDDDEEMIDMEMDDCSSDDEHGGPH